MQGPIKAGKFGAVVFFCGETSFASLIGRITFFNCNHHVTTILFGEYISCLLYTSPSPRDGLLSRMPSSA